MNNRFDELTKNVAQSVARRGAVKKFGAGLATIALACFGLVNKAEAAPARNKRCFKMCMENCLDYYVSQGQTEEGATSLCQGHCAFQCTRFP